MDDKKEIKRFIMFICDWVEDAYKKEGHIGFSYDFNNDKTAYLVNDKGIEKRIQKELYKRLGLDSFVIYTLLPSDRAYLSGELRIRLYDQGANYEYRNK